MIIRKEIRVKISIKSLQLKFIPCELDYIINECHGRCCQSKDSITVTIHQSEQSKIEQLGASVKDGFIVAGQNGLCPFKLDSGLCSIHTEKPFGCIASPFTLNSNNTLVVRNRYRIVMPCYRNLNNYKTVPVYEAHHTALIFIFGEEEAERIIEVVKSYTPYNSYTTPQSFDAFMSPTTYDILMENDFAKSGKPFHNLNPKSSTFNDSWNGLVEVV